MKKMVYCAAFNCKNGSNNNQKSEKKVSFFSFPKDEKIRKVWTEKVRRKNWKPSNSSRLCSDHFDDSCYSQNLSVLHAIGWTASKLILNSDAIPNIFNYAGINDSKRKQPESRRSGALAKRRRQEVSWIFFTVELFARV